jgi:hypothetical protein
MKYTQSFSCKSLEEAIWKTDVDVYGSIILKCILHNCGYIINSVIAQSV